MNSLYSLPCVQTGNSSIFQKYTVRTSNDREYR